MTTLTLREDVGLTLTVSRAADRVSAILALPGLHTCVATADARYVIANAAGFPCLRVGEASFPLSFAQLREAADALHLQIGQVNA